VIRGGKTPRIAAATGFQIVSEARQRQRRSLRRRQLEFSVPGPGRRRVRRKDDCLFCRAAAWGDWHSHANWLLLASRSRSNSRTINRTPSA